MQGSIVGGSDTYIPRSYGPPAEDEFFDVFFNVFMGMPIIDDGDAGYVERDPVFAPGGWGYTHSEIEWLPAVIGVAWLGDQTRNGLGWMVAAGLTIAVGATLVLARFGEAPTPEPA